ncbi:Desmethyl-deoxy-podophyllotoxin synthase [Linum perenne]
MEELSSNFTLIVILLITIIPTTTILIFQTLTRKIPSPPGPWKLPVIGNLHQMVLGMGNPLPHRRLRDLAARYGPLMHLQLGEVSTIVVSSGELAQEFLQTNDLNFASRAYLPSAHTIFYQSRNISFGTYGAYWHRMRKICVQELLGANRVRSFLPTMKEEVDKIVRSVGSTRSSVNVTRMLYSLGYSVISRSVFGETQHQEHADAFYPVLKEIIRALEGSCLWDVFPSSNLARVLSEGRLKKLNREFDALLQTIIDDHIAKRSEKKKKNNDVDEGEGFLDVLLNHTVDQDVDVPVTNNDIKAVLLDILLGGSDTFAVVIEWALSELMKNPKAMQKLQTEIRKQVGQKGRVDQDDLGQLHYLKLVPPGPLLAPRQAREDTMIHGYQIPEKTRIIINAWAIGRDHLNWAEPDKFDPERFMLDDYATGDYTKGLDFSMIPFGSGRRMCPGVHYGMAVLSLCLANLVYCFDWELLDGVMAEDLDMSEDFGIVVRRKKQLVLMAVPYGVV